MRPEPSFAPRHGPRRLCWTRIAYGTGGWRAFDRDDREIAGNFASAEMAVKALLEAGGGGAGLAIIGGGRLIVTIPPWFELVRPRDKQELLRVGGPQHH
jgi:hypothetical protein